MTETDLMWALVRAIPHAIPDARPFRRAVFNVRAEQGFRAKAGVPGQCDLYVYVKPGRIIEVETKARRGVLSPRQRVWQAFCHEWGVPHVVLKERNGETSDATVARWVGEIRMAASWL